MPADLFSILQKTAREYNRYRSPEATAEVLEVRRDGFTVRFTGSFCRTCGFYDYFEDFLVFLEEHGRQADVEAIEEVPGGADVVFQLVQ